MKHILLPALAALYVKYEVGFTLSREYDNPSDPEQTGRCIRFDLPPGVIRLIKIEE